MPVNDEHKNTLYSKTITFAPEVDIIVRFNQLKAENMRLKEELKQLRALSILKGAHYVSLG